MSTDGGTISAVDDRFISGLSPRQKARFVPGCRTMEKRVFVFVNPFHARHVREARNTKKRNPIYTDGGTKPLIDNRFIIYLSTDRKALFLFGCRPMERRFFCYCQVLPGHTLHEKGKQRQTGFAPLFVSQDQRALLVPIINC